MEADEITAILSIEDEIDRDQAILKLLRTSPSNVSSEELESRGERIDGPYERTEGYIGLFEHSRNANPDRAFAYLEKAIDSTTDTTEAWQKGELLSKIGSIYATEGHRERTIAVWELGVSSTSVGLTLDNPQDEHDCSSVLAEIAVKMINVQEEVRAVEIAKLIPIEAIRQRIVSELGR